MLEPRELLLTGDTLAEERMVRLEGERQLFLGNAIFTQQVFKKGRRLGDGGGEATVFDSNISSASQSQFCEHD